MALGAEPPPQPEVRPAAKEIKPVRSYREVLAMVPKELDVEKAAHWSQAEKDAANLFLKKRLLDTKRRGVFFFKAEDIADWGQLTLWSHLSDEDNYWIRVFSAKFTGPNPLGHLAQIHQGDRVRLEGTFVQAKFEDLWNGPSFTICFEDCIVTKVLANGKPAPEPGKIDLNVISATYGSGDHFADVSDRVKEILAAPGAEFAAKPDWLGADPTPGWNKALVIVYEFQGKRRLFNCGEGGAVSAAILAAQAAKQD